MFLARQEAPARAPAQALVTSDHDALTRFLSDLRSRTPETRAQAAKSLRVYVEAEAREMSSDSFTKFMNDLNRRIFDLVNSQDVHEKMGGINVIDELLDVPYEENETKILRFANYLRMLFQQSGTSDNSDQVPALLETAAKALGHLARAGATLTSEIVEVEVRRALEWLEGERSAHQRHAAVLILRELAESTPTLFSSHVQGFLTLIWVALRDPREHIRDAAIQALRACLVLIAQRDVKWRNQWYEKVFLEVQNGFKSDTALSIHGSLLTISELLRNTGDFMLARFKEVCDAVWKQREYRDKDVRETVIMLLPQLAAFCPEAFVRGYLDICLQHIIDTINKGNTKRGLAYIALGEMALAVKDHIDKHLAVIIGLVKEGLNPKGGKAFSTNALTCVSMLARAVGSKLTPHIMNDLVEQMFSAGLSPTLIEALTELCIHIPALLPLVQDRLLSVISAVLTATAKTQTTLADSQPVSSRRTTVVPGSNPATSTPGGSSHLYRAPLTFSSASKTDNKSSLLTGFGLGLSQSNEVPPDPALVPLALRTLGSFNFDSKNLLPFARECVLPFLDGDNPAFRQAAALTLTQLILRPNAGGSKDHPLHLRAGNVSLTTMMYDVLERLLTVGITDSDASVRRAVLEALDQRFDPFLAQTGNLQSLFVALNDEVFAVREVAISTIGRLALRNPAYVMPSLRKTLIQLLTELQYGGEARNREESSKLLGHLIDSSQRLMRPYVAPIVKVLAGRLSDPDPNVASCVLETVGKVAIIASGTREIEPYLDLLIPLIISTLQSKNNISQSKREVALRTMGHIIGSTGYVITPYLVYPSLLPTVLNVLRAGAPISSHVSSQNKLLRDTSVTFDPAATSGSASGVDLHPPAVVSAMSSSSGWAVRREVIRVLGVIGALDPFRQKMNQLMFENNVLAVESGDDSKDALTTTGGNANNKDDDSGKDREKQLALQLVKHVVRNPKAAAMQVNMYNVEKADEGFGQVPTQAVAAPPGAPQGPLPADGSAPSIAVSSDDYYPTVAVNALVRILREPALSQHHSKVIGAIMFILKSLGIQSVPYLQRIIPAFLDVLSSRSGIYEDSLRETLFRELGVVLAIVKQNIRPYLPGILQLVHEYWDDSQLLNEQILSLVEKISLALKDEFKIYLPDLVPPLLNVIQSDRSDSRLPTLKVLHALETFGPNLDDYLHLTLPAVIKVIESPEVPLEVRRMAIGTLGRLSRLLNFSDFSSRIVHPLLRVIDTASALLAPSGSSAQAAVGAATTVAAIRVAAVDTLCCLVYQLGPNFALYMPVVSKIMAKHKLRHETYDNLVNKLLKNQPFTPDDIATVAGAINDGSVVHMQQLMAAESKGKSSADYEWADVGMDNAGAGGAAQKLVANQVNLKKAWDASQRSTKEDWAEWMRGFSIELLKESPSPALRACCILAQKYHPLARELFNAAFVSCWNELQDQFQDDLVKNLERAFESPNLSPEIIQTLLNLAEFMEHDNKRLPIDIRTLGSLAEKCHAYAKALHYKELEFNTSPATTIEALISINNQLGQPEAAVGILQYAKTHHALALKETWYEKLHRWEDALEEYERKQLENENWADVELTLGRMRCLKSLGEWDRLADLACELWNRKDDAPASSGGQGGGGGSVAAIGASALALRKKIAALGAHAAWNMGRCDSEEMRRYVAGMEDGIAEKEFFRALMAAHAGNFSQARTYIDLCRGLLDVELTALVGESYNRAYRVVVQTQQLAELEEIISYREITAQSKEGDFGIGQFSPAGALAERARIRSMWSERLKGCQRDVDVWQQMLAVRSTVLSRHEDIPTWLKFSSLCRKSGRMSLSLKILTSLMGCDPLEVGRASVHVNEDEDFPVVPVSIPTSQPAVGFAYAKHLWAAGFRSEAHQGLQSLVASMQSINPASLVRASSASSSIRPHSVTGSGDVSSLLGNTSTSLAGFGSPGFGGQDAETNGAAGAQSPGDGASPPGAIASVVTTEELLHLKAKCYLKLGSWQLALREELDDQIIPNVINSFYQATQCDPQSYKVWHAWAVMNYRVVQHLRNKEKDKDASGAAKPDGKSAAPASALPRPGASPIKPTTKDDSQPSSYVVPAIKGFFRSIGLAGNQSEGLQDILRLLTLWFAHGNHPTVEAALVEGFNTVTIDTWLTVIPQIIARIDISFAPVRRLIHTLLSKIGRAHPQALIYPLTVASKSLTPSRKAAAVSIMDDMRQHSPVLVDQALLVSRELIRVAILWHEMWHEGLEEASRQWFGQRNVDGMLATLAPLHEMMEKGPETLREVAFQQMFGRDLQEAQEWTRKYMDVRSRTGAGKESDLNQAWDLYCTVFRKINKQLTQLTDLELQYVSPRLQSARNLELAVPGSYRSGSGAAAIRIAFFVSSLRVIESKQRPRKLQIRGSDGLEYSFLLKGHEDLRQDERVMQLFGLVNTLLSHDRETSKKDLRIRGYSVIPLAPNSGLIQWLPHCDTMHALIKEYRDSRKILLNIEHRLMTQMAPDYQHLTLIQRVEVFEYALSNTTGQDLCKVLWLKSKDSETWLDRRTNYTRSLAVMSMVGYILGLGDRHPCNLMVDQYSGKIIHIDFGDCFEVAMVREKFPEKVPFRLTRMLVNAMEVSGIEGNFRFTCENVMRVLRDNKESVMAVLEAFVYDPLINWRLLKTTKSAMHAEPQEDGRIAVNKIELESIARSAAAAGGLGAALGKKEPEVKSGGGTGPATNSNALSALNALDPSDDSASSDVLNAKALSVLSRVEAKLTGRDFGREAGVLDTPAQVQKLIEQATSRINLCQCYIGWCPFW